MPTTLNRAKLVDDGARLLQAAMWYEWNTNGKTIIEAAYGTNHTQGYLNGKMAKLRKGGLLALYSILDNEGRRRLVDAIIERYGNHAGLRF